MSKCTFCPLPWNSINLRNNGDMRICCNTNSYSPQRGIMKKEDGTPYNAGKDDWNEARNAELLKEVRVSMMKGEWHPECTRCKKEEESGIKSRRIYEGDDWSVNSGNLTEEKARANKKEITKDEAENILKASQAQDELTSSKNKKETKSPNKTKPSVKKTGKTSSKIKPKAKKVSKK